MVVTASRPVEFVNKMSSEVDEVEMTLNNFLPRYNTFPRILHLWLDCCKAWRRTHAAWRYWMCHRSLVSLTQKSVMFGTTPVLSNVFFYSNSRGKVIKPLQYQSTVAPGTVARVEPNIKWFGEYGRLSPLKEMLAMSAHWQLLLHSCHLA